MLDIDSSDIPQGYTRKTHTPGAGWINLFLLRRRGDRGDIIASIAMWSFLAMLVCILFGGSSFKSEQINIVIPSIDWQIVVGLITPVLAHVIKGTAESVKGR